MLHSNKKAYITGLASREKKLSSVLGSHACFVSYSNFQTIILTFGLILCPRLILSLQHIIIFTLLGTIYLLYTFFLTSSQDDGRGHSLPVDICL